MRRVDQRWLEEFDRSHTLWIDPVQNSDVVAGNPRHRRYEPLLVQLLGLTLGYFVIAVGLLLAMWGILGGQG